MLYIDFNKMATDSCEWMKSSSVYDSTPSVEQNRSQIQVWKCWFDDLSRQYKDGNQKNR